MGMENLEKSKLSEPKIVGKIDVSAWNGYDRFKRPAASRPEAYLPNLKELLASQAQESNLSLENFLDDEARIIVSGDDAESHNYLVSVQEETYSRAEGKTVEDWRRDKEKHVANLTEMALTAMFYKFLHEKFIVARSSTFDDYNNGVDQVLVDKETGEVVCGFDEVIVNPNDNKEKAKKETKLNDIMAKGGANITYGAKLEEGKLVRSEVRRVPAFYVSLRREELGELLECLKNNPEKITSFEEGIFSKLLDSFQSQILSKNLNSKLAAKTNSVLAKLKIASNLNRENLAA